MRIFGSAARAGTWLEPSHYRYLGVYIFSGRLILPDGFINYNIGVPFENKSIQFTLSGAVFGAESGMILLWIKDKFGRWAILHRLEV